MNLCRDIAHYRSQGMEVSEKAAVDQMIYLTEVVRNFEAHASELMNQITTVQKVVPPQKLQTNIASSDTPLMGNADDAAQQGE